MKPAKELWIGLSAGILLTGLSLGIVGYIQIQALNAENSRLKMELKKADWRQQNLSKAQASLQTELDGFKAQKEQAYEQTVNSLMQAKADADIDALYALGLKALQQKDYPRAYFALSQVSQQNGAYKEIAKYYPQAQKAYASFQQKQLQSELASSYAQALDHQLKGQLAQAQSAYQHVLELQPKYKDAPARLASVSRYLSAQQKTREAEQKSKWLLSTYQLGLKEQSLGRYAQAKAAFDELHKYAPKYKDVAQRLKTVTAQLPKELQVAKASGPACYAKGVIFGNCLKTQSAGPNCKQLNLSAVPAECSGNPEFQKGFSSITNATNQETLNMAKEFPNWLKNL